jgi:hypothetical protein
MYVVDSSSFSRSLSRASAKQGRKSSEFHVEGVKGGHVIGNKGSAIKM